VPAPRLGHHRRRGGGRDHDAVVLVDQPGDLPHDRLEPRPDEALRVVDDEGQLGVAAAQGDEVLHLAGANGSQEPAAAGGHRGQDPPPADHRDRTATASQRARAPLAAVILVVIIAAIVGDSVGYEVGRRVGSRILHLRILQKRRKRLDDAQDFLARRGGAAVFLGRWVAFFRAVMPALAGTARMPYPKFLAFNAAGGIVWGIAVVLIGYFAGQSYAKVEATLGRAAALVVLGIALIAMLVWQIRKHRAESADETTAAS